MAYKWYFKRNASVSCGKRCFDKGIEIQLKVELVMQPAIDNEDTNELKKFENICMDFKHSF